MATLGQYVTTLADLAKNWDPDGNQAAVVELLAQQNAILQDMSWMEGNLPTGHRTTVRTGLPTPAWALLNQGVQPTKSTEAQIDEACATLIAWNEVDERVAKLGGNVDAFRASRARAHIQAMGIEMAATLFYGNSTTAPNEFTGLAPRYSSLTAAIGDNIVDAGGTGSDNSSIWLVNWGTGQVSGIYPTGTQAGLQHEDYGLETVETSAAIAGTRMRAYRERFKWDCGLCVEDWRYAVRICNIDISALVARTSPADLYIQMVEAVHRIESVDVGRPVFYCNRTVFKELEIQARNDVQTGGQLSYDVVDGVRKTSFQGIPIRVCDALLETEARVT